MLRHFVRSAGLVAVVTVVAGSQAPSWPQREAKLVVDIGTKPNSNNEVFAGINAVQIARDGRIFVMESRPCTVKVFDATGKFVRKFGSEGRGDGQCTRPLGMTVTDSGVFVIDGATVPSQLPRQVRFTLDGKPMPSVAPDTAPRATGYRPIAMRGGTRLLYEYDRANKRSLWRLMRPGDDIGDVFVEMPLDQPDVTRLGAPSGGVSGFGVGGVFSRIGDSAAIHVDGVTGAVRWYAFDSTGAKVVRTDTLGVQAVPATDEDVAKRVAELESRPAMQAGGGPPQRMTPGSITMMNAPKHWSVATMLMFDRAGSAWIGAPRRNAVMGGQTDTSTVTYAVFPPSGAPYKVTLPTRFIIVAIIDGRVYGYEIVRSGIVKVYDVGR